MAATGAKALPYPVPSDPVPAGADNMRKLAQSVDNMVQVGTVTLDLSTTETNVTVSVTFPVAYASNPQVVACGANAPPTNGAVVSSFVWTTGLSPTGCQIGARRSGSLASFTARWMAVGPVTAVA